MPFSLASFFASGLAKMRPPIPLEGENDEAGVGAEKATGDGADCGGDGFCSTLAGAAGGAPAGALKSASVGT